MSNPTLDAWHRMIQERNAAALDDVLADDAVFHSPVVHTPQEGKALTKLYLSAAIMVLISVRLYSSNVTLKKGLSSAKMERCSNASAQLLVKRSRRWLNPASSSPSSP